MASEIERASVRPGTLKNQHLHAAADIEPSKMAQQALAEFPLRLQDLASYLGYVPSDFGTGPPQIRTQNVRRLGSKTRRGPLVVVMPDNYEAGESVEIRCVAGMRTTVADTTATIDVEAYLLLDDGTLSSDLCITEAKTINSLTLGDKDFELDATDLEPGSRIDVRVTFALNDAAGLAAVIGVLQKISLRCDTRG